MYCNIVLENTMIKLILIQNDVCGWIKIRGVVGALKVSLGQVLEVQILSLWVRGGQNRPVVA